MTEIMPPTYVKPLQKVSLRKGGSKAAKDKMHGRNYDPVDAMVDLYERLVDEDRIMCAVRDGSLVKLTEAGPKQRYSSMAHAALLAQIQRVHADLLRYGYARVPENQAITPDRSPFIIELEGDEVRVINED